MSDNHSSYSLTGLKTNFLLQVICFELLRHNLGIKLVDKLGTVFSNLDI
jgi:hypothetical protein